MLCQVAHTNEWNKINGWVTYGSREQRVWVQVCALGKRNVDNVWVATEGVYFPTKEA